MNKILKKAFWLSALLAGGRVALAAEYTEDWLYITLINLINIGRNVLFILAGALIIWAAFLFLTSGGAPEKIKTAKNVLIYAILAIVLGLIAFGVAGFVGSLIGEEPPITY
jgi:VIT1/CCC1 family predicted Fe2+/Mn2+ transporter